MQSIEAMNTCAMCEGRFPGPGIESGGQLYCCDKCADYGHHRLHMVAAMAPKVMGMLAVGGLIGYLIGRNRN